VLYVHCLSCVLLVTLLVTYTSVKYYVTPLYVSRINLPKGGGGVGGTGQNKMSRWKRVALGKGLDGQELRRFIETSVLNYHARNTLRLEYCLGHLGPTRVPNSRFLQAFHLSLPLLCALLDFSTGTIPLKGSLSLLCCKVYPWHPPLCDRFFTHWMYSKALYFFTCCRPQCI
jgi:hypothetical protein